MRFWRYCACCAAIQIFALGCGSGSQTGKVTGTITLDGKPLPNILVSFQPVGSQTPNTADETSKKGKSSAPNRMASYGSTDADGKFRLQLSDKSGYGALVGEHVVTLTEVDTAAKDGADAPPPSNPMALVKGPKMKPKEAPIPKIPPKWSDRSSRFTVKAGTNLFDVDVVK